MPASEISPELSTAAVALVSPSSSDCSSRPDHAAQSPAALPVPSSTDTPSGGRSTSTDVLKADVSTAESEKHPRGKRKRTAAKDKTILENAYLANPKPDKTARLDIVKRVSLNEKEVQIWFQNRRQNDRRKSRPLSAQEIAALRYGGMQILSSDPVTCTLPLTEEKSPAAAIAHSASGNTTAPMETPVKCHAAGVDDTATSSRNVSPSHAYVGDRTLETPSSSQVSDHGYQAHSASFSFSSSVGCRQNGWDTSNSFTTPSTVNRNVDEAPRHLTRSEQCPPSSCSSTASAAPILPPQSHVRLSLSLEGKAEVVSNEASPSRPQSSKPFSDLPSLPHVRARPFQRSHSAVSSVTLPPISALTDSLPPTLGRGRSRDAHAWELCCDADARDELTTQAENESNGSAVAAISLLRSTSGILHNNSFKRNSPASRPAYQAQQAKKPKLSRSSSSAARMQTTIDGVDKGADRTVDDRQPGSKLKDGLLVSPSGDSDKENWFPAKEGNPRWMASLDEVRMPIPTTAVNKISSRRTGRILQDHPGPVIFSGARTKTMPAMGRRDSGKYLSIYEDDGESPAPKATDEVESFMRGEVSPSKKGDMLCIEGLLSLSQGNWR
ncbi:homeobox transcription factor [Colletotrichum musicola]|uniref:Homeobox transcription factor n=1 Tax=Colletotrichum musicola TaxID=2175873 RepID=A0A8H6NXR4_9PEZI|nr:homeobox transcription factor [Colletotrichum musicola]